MPALMSLAMLQVDGLDAALLGLLIILVAGIAGWYLWSVRWALTTKPMTGPEALVGKSGVAIEDFNLDNTGEVNIAGIIWKARTSDDAKISKKDPVIVIDYSDLSVVVKKT
jgi:membrane protein implicated in regulation of membrane protease activity